MAIEINEFTEQMRLELEKYKLLRSQNFIDAAFSGVALAKNRIIRDRENAEGGIFGIYQPETIKRKIKSGRVSAGGNISNINFVDTGRMLRTTRPQIESVTDTRVVVVVKPSDPQRAEVMAHLDRRGYNGTPIMQLSQDEVNLIIDTFSGTGLISIQ